MLLSLLVTNSNMRLVKPQGRDVMSFGNVELNNAREGEDKNASEMVVARGFASVVRHRSDEERSSVYETLLELEEKAKQVGYGVMLELCYRRFHPVR